MHVQTLGALEAGIKPIKPKNLLLLCYLALEGKQDRKHLQMLFWPEAADPATSLRVALSYLQGLGKDLFRSVQNQVESLIHTDAQELTQFYQQQQYSEVIKLYSGAFLKGLDLKNSSTELEDWIFETREKLASLVQWSVLYEAQKVRSSMPDRFQVLAEQFFQIDGAPPPTLEMLRFLYTLGLEGYLEHRVLKEAAELGVDLTTLQVPQKTNLQTAIRPVQVFVGRAQELQFLQERLLQTPPAIVTITGLGGVGKSTLVRAYCAEHHPEDTLWLKADGLKDASGLLHQLGLNVQQADPWVGLTDTLRYHKGIVVIDGADQLSGLEHLQNWLRFPDLRVIVTCRQPLQLPEESLLKLEPFSIQEYRGMGFSEVLNHPAVQCFEKHAKRNHAAFKIRPDDAQDVVHLCAALSGLPLALEMASSWTQILSLKEIREEVQQVVDPEGDPQSLKPIFEASWNLLSEQEKQALTNLNCFLGSFTREAAVIVIGVQLRTLQQLVRKSMLQLEPGQRFRVPQVLRGFISEPPAEVRKQHQEYHLHLLNTMEATPGKGLTDYSGAVPDLMDVLRRSLPGSTPKTLPLLRLFESGNLRSAGLHFYSDLVKGLSIETHAEFYLEYAWLCLWGNLKKEALKICNLLMSIFENHSITMRCLNIKGLIYMDECNYVRSRKFLGMAYEMSKQIQNPARMEAYGFNLLWITSNLLETIETVQIYSEIMNYGDRLSQYSLMRMNYIKIVSEYILKNEIDFNVIRILIKECSNRGFNDLVMYLMLFWMEAMPAGASRREVQLVMEECEVHVNASGSSSALNQFAVNKFKYACRFEQKIVESEFRVIIESIKQSRDKLNLIRLVVFLGQIQGLLPEEQAFLLKVPYFSAHQRQEMHKTLKSHPHVLVDGLRTCAALSMEALEWMMFMDHLQGLEDLPPPSGEQQYPQAPHPRSRELRL